MANWVEKYKKLAYSSNASHVIIADADNLFSYRELRHSILEDGYKIIETKSGLDVRVKYELEVRGNTEKIILVAPANYEPLPDILEDVHFQSIGLNQLFPNLDSKAIKGLSFNALCLLSEIKHYEALGHDKTLRFLLENLYNVDFNTLTINKPKEKIINALITVFLEKNGINLPIQQYLSALIKPYFPDLVEKGLSQINIIEFLQGQWEEFITNGTALINFEEPILNKNLGYLFIFKHLAPILVSDAQYKSIPKSLRIGVFTDEKQNLENEFGALIQYLEQQNENIEDLYDQWFILIQVLANAKLLFIKSGNSDLKTKYIQIETILNQRFQRYVDNVYNSLFSLSGVRKPIVVTRILDYIKSQPDEKKALIVLDGINYWQWLLIGKAFSDANISFNTKSTFAYIPTITAYSRQAIFKGGKPDLNSDNSKEDKLFSEFWKQKGYKDIQIQYKKFGVNQPLDFQSIPDTVSILALVCNDLDEIMHGSILGNEQLWSSTEQWIIQSKIVTQIASLIKLGFTIYLTTDHGNIEAVGIKNLQLKDKVGTISRSKRHLHFSNNTMADSFKELNAGIAIGSKGNSVYLKNNEAFTDPNTTVITHGGSHIWEVIIPFIEIK